MQTEPPSATPPLPAAPRPPLPPHARRAGVALLCLLPLSDWLLFDLPPGLSLALLVPALFGAALWVRPVPFRQGRGPAVLVGLGCLPLLEQVQALSIVLAAAALLIALAWAQGRPRDWLRPLLHLPVTGPGDAVTAARGLRGKGGGLTPAALLSGWALPVGGALVLLGLLAQANPLLDGWLDAAAMLQVDTARLLWRGLFWIGCALVFWPLLREVPAGRPVVRARQGIAGINQGSVARALILFNLMLLVQTVTDARFLWAGAALPEGMSYASYAHRGAYPLLATALLAIAFSLVARPHLEGSRLLRGLLVLWLLQNLALTASSGLRLSVYVEAYGLTYLRCQAAIWMGLVAAGLGLALWQVARDRTTDWLLLRGAILAGAVVYACAFVNVAGLIASHNLSRAAGMDRAYICGLPPTADAAILAAGNPLRCPVPGPQITDWRDWGFRAQRVRSRLHALQSTI